MIEEKSSRRGFLKSSAAGAGVVFSPALARAATAPAIKGAGSIKDVEHVVILMQENRAFDHYFGCLRGVRGFGDPRPLLLPSGKSVFHQPVQPGVADVALPFRLDASATNAESLASLDHSWKGQHRLWRNHDAWLSVKGPMTMGYFTREDIPFYYALADAFTVCDAYHCSIFGPTNPNRLFLFSGTSGLSVGHSGAQATANDDDGNWTADAARDDKAFSGYGWTTYAERLEAAGVSWKLYQEYDNFGDNSLAFFKAFRGLDPAAPLHRKARAWVEGSTRENAFRSKGEAMIATFSKDVREDSLPQVSWLVAPTGACEHPAASPSVGEAFTAALVEALAANAKVFAKTVFILNYDENDGFFDHALPPTPAISAGQGASTASPTGEIFSGQPVGLGPRVPMIVVSPWTRGGWVNSQLFDHTSVLRFLEARFGVAEPNISPWRRAITGDLTSVFDFSQKATPPRLPPTLGLVARMEAARKLPAPVPLEAGGLPAQEAGVRPARPLPYAIDVSARSGQPGGALKLSFRNDGSVGVWLSAHADEARLGPWSYTVEAGKALSTIIPAPVTNRYGVTLLGPNGFLRAYRGSADQGGGAEVDSRMEPARRRIVLILRNSSTATSVFTVAPNAYSAVEPRVHTLAAGESLEDAWDLHRSGNWYDLIVTRREEPGYLRRLAGHMEDGAASISDPAFTLANGRPA